MTTNGIHHVTAICGHPQPSLEFHGGVLGLRFIKQTVNFDDPTTYHFYYGDGIGSPGSIVTFFPWPGGMRGQAGKRQAIAIRLAVDENALGFWIERLIAKNIKFEGPLERFEESYIKFADPDGIALELVGNSFPPIDTYNWRHDEISSQNAIRGVHSVEICVEGYDKTAEIITKFLELEHVEEHDNLFRLKTDQESIGSVVDIKRAPGFRNGRSGVGTIHHVAFRAEDDTQQLTTREELLQYGLHVTTQLDRNYFHSIYFREPGGVLFEIATDGPGFSIDEEIELLGRSLQLPDQYESQRDEIVAALPSLKLPS